MPAAGPRRRVAVVFGGRSTEHAISCVSAGSVLEALDGDRWEVVAVGITPDGRWVRGPEDPKELAISGPDLPSVDAGGAPVALIGDPNVRGLVGLVGLTQPSPGAGSPAPVPIGDVDVVFPVLHGPYGEDGTIQGLLELAGIPYVGSGVLASAAAMDKEYMKLLLAARGLPVGPYVVLRAGEPVAPAYDLRLPVFVKPARAGSSVGITKVSRWPDLADAVEVARRHDPKVLVEAAVPGREIECGLLQRLTAGPPDTSVPAEVHVPGTHEFYDFDAKYLDEATSFDVPAQLPPEVEEHVRTLAARAFSALDCESLARVDFFLRPDGSLLVNEVNTMPGFTPASMFPRMWAASGLDYPALIERLLVTALARRPGLR